MPACRMRARCRAAHKRQSCLLDGGISSIGEAGRATMEVCYDELVANLGGAGSYGLKTEVTHGYLVLFADSVATADRVINGWEAFAIFGTVWALSGFAPQQSSIIFS